MEYWLSIGMYLSHGFHILSTVFAAEQMDDQSTVMPDDSEEVEQSIN